MRIITFFNVALVVNIAMAALHYVSVFDGSQIATAGAGPIPINAKCECREFCRGRRATNCTQFSITSGIDGSLTCLLAWEPMPKSNMMREANSVTYVFEPNYFITQRLFNGVMSVAAMMTACSNENGVLAYLFTDEDFHEMERNTKTEGVNLYFWIGLFGAVDREWGDTGRYLSPDHYIMDYIGSPHHFDGEECHLIWTQSPDKKYQLFNHECAFDGRPVLCRHVLE